MRMELKYPDQLIVRDDDNKVIAVVETNLNGFIGITVTKDTVIHVNNEFREHVATITNNHLKDR